MRRQVVRPRFRWSRQLTHPLQDVGARSMQLGSFATARRAFSCARSTTDGRVRRIAEQPRILLGERLDVAFGDGIAIALP